MNASRHTSSARPCAVMEPLEASASLRAWRGSRSRAGDAPRAGGVGVSDSRRTRTASFHRDAFEAFTLTDDDDVRAAPATFSRDRPNALRANHQAARPAADEGATDGTSRAFAASTESEATKPFVGPLESTARRPSDARRGARVRPLRDGRDSAVFGPLDAPERNTFRSPT